MFYEKARNLYVYQKKIRLPLAKRIQLLEQTQHFCALTNPEDVYHNHALPQKEDKVSKQTIGTYDHTNR